MILNNERTQTQQTSAQDALCSWVEKRFKELARGRWAEEREWFQAGMFDQSKQWLTPDKVDGKKLKEIKGKDNKFPMPVSNHFSKAVSVNANMLGAAIPEMLALADNYDANNRRAAEAASNAIDAANEESGMNSLNPTLARQIVLWGLGCTKDTVAFDHSTDEFPEFEATEPTIGPDGQLIEQDPQVVGSQQQPTPRLKTELVPIFQVYLPRDCQDSNLAGVVIERPRMALGKARELYPKFSEDFSKDQGDIEGSLAHYFLDSLRYLSYSSKQDSSDEKVTLTECWVDWSELSKEVQDAITKEWEGEPSTIYGEQGMSKLEAAIQFGIFVTIWNSKVLDWGENPWDGEKPYTFYPWQKDVASVYPKGLSTDLVPLQKQLNRLRSLAERAVMSNAAVKVLWPITQTTPAPTGDPVDMIYYDPIGDGKLKPELFGGRAIDTVVFKMIEMILADFAELSMSNAVSEGNSPGAGTAYRALAFMGSKAEESRRTQRYLYEASHEIRARKIVKIIRKIWSVPRKINTAGFNNRNGAEQLAASDLEGSYELRVIQDSSRPKTLTEKMEAFQLLLQGGMINPQDPTVREYVTDTLGIEDVNLTDHLEFTKAGRDIEVVKNGMQPSTNPYMDWGIHLHIFSDYIQTEEYEALPQPIQAGFLAYASWLQQMAAPPPMGLPGLPKTGPEHPLSKALASKGGIGGQPPGHVLHQVPGQTVSPDQAQQAASIEANALVPNTDKQ